MKQKKRRPSYADESTRLVVRLREYCCEHGLIFQGEPSEDCGVDCYIEVATNGSPHNFIVGVQCKTGQSYRRTSKEGVRVSVRQVDVDYWLAANYPLVLAYWDDIEGRGYFKHIQDHIEKTLSKRSHAIQDITFFDADRIDGDQLASYVRNLVVQTPSASSRLADLRGGASMLTESGKISLTKVRGCSFDPSALLDQWRVAWQDAGSPAQVLAFSNDDRWVMEMYRRPLGMTGVDDVTVVLRDLVFFRAVTLNLYTYEDFVKDGEGFASSAIAPARLEEFLARMQGLQSNISRLSWNEARDVYSVEAFPYEFVPLNLSFGQERFEMGIEPRGSRQAMVLSNKKYVPPRNVPLLLERNEFGWDAAVDEPYPIAPRILSKVCGVALSSSAKRISLIVSTNPENGCWGHPRVEILHIELDALRQECVRALH